MTQVLTIRGVRPAYVRGFSSYKRGSEGSRVSFANSILLSSLLSRFVCRLYPEAPVIFPSPEARSEAPRIPKSVIPEPKPCPRGARFFVKIFQIYGETLLLQAVVLPDRLPIRWVYSPFSIHDIIQVIVECIWEYGKWVCSHFHSNAILWSILYKIRAMCIYFAVICVNVYSLSSIS